jgi:hypothetical protein
VFKKILIANRGVRASAGARSQALAPVSVHHIAWRAQRAGDRAARA